MAQQLRPEELNLLRRCALIIKQEAKKIKEGDPLLGYKQSKRTYDRYLREERDLRDFITRHDQGEEPGQQS